jgi:hypothetical protein
MENVKYEIRGGKLHLEIDLAASLPGTTKSGNVMCATSGNWVKLPEAPGFSLNMVLVKKPGTAVPADSRDETMVVTTTSA